MLPRLPGGAADGSSADAPSPSRPGTPSGLLPKVSSRPATASVPMSSQPKTSELPTLSVEESGIFQDLADPETNTEANILIIDPLADAEPAAHEHEKQLADPLAEPPQDLSDSTSTFSTGNERVLSEGLTEAENEKAAVAPDRSSPQSQTAGAAPGSFTQRRFRAMSRHVATKSQTLQKADLPPSRHSSSATQRDALLSTLSGQGAREARKKIERILKDEAQQADLLVTLQRRVVGRKDPCKFLMMLKKDDKALERWHDGAQKKHSDFEAAVVIQRKWLFGDDTAKATLMLSAKLARSRAFMRYELLDILELRDDVRTQAFEFFAQTAPPLASRVRELKNRLAEVQAKAERDAAEGKEGARITSTKHPGFFVVQNLQQDLMQTHTKLKAIQKLMLTFATREEMSMLKEAGKDGDPTTLLRELLSVKKHAVTPSRSETGRKGWSAMGRWKTEQRRDFLKSSSIGPERHTTKNALEEIRALREEMRQVNDATDRLQRTRNDLASIQAGRPVQAIEDAEEARAFAKQRADSEAAMQQAVLNGLFGGKKMGPPPINLRKGNSELTGKPKSIAMLTRKHGIQGLAAAVADAKGRITANANAARDVKAEAEAKLASQTQAPLWTFSPKDGWKADHVASRPPSRLKTSSLNLTQLQVPNETTALDGTMLSSNVTPANIVDPVTRAYNARPGSKMSSVRYDVSTSSWIPNSSPVQFPSRYTKAESLRPSRSLPSSMSETYLRPQWEYRPRTPAHTPATSIYRPKRPASPPQFERTIERITSDRAHHTLERITSSPARTRRA